MQARLIGSLVCLGLGLTGCHFYIDGEEEEIGDPPFEEDDWFEDCESNADCPAGCICDYGVCVETESEWWCTSDEDCFDGGVCVEGWCTDPEPTCLEDADCEPGQICDPAVLDCRPALACEEHSSRESCEAEASLECEVVTRGINCTHPDGGDCEVDPEPCTCESFEFAACVSADPAP